VSKAKITASAPVLLVANVVKAAAYYRDQLGFTEVKLYHEPPDFAMVSRDQHIIMLAQAAHPVRILPNWKIHPSSNNVYIWVDDVDALYAEYQASGANIDFTLYDTPWGTREFGVQDVDGYDIAFGQVAG
jgi:uncharacterized glyoxalase superfamily protein PhnB